MFTVNFNLVPSKKINILFAVLLIWGNQQVFSQTTQSFDIVVYGGTSAGISSAIQSSRLGKKVILIEPTNRIGGLTTGGLGQTDIGNKQAIGGISREFYQNIKSYYQNQRTGTGKSGKRIAMADKQLLQRMKMPCGPLNLQQRLRSIKTCSARRKILR